MANWGSQAQLLEFSDFCHMHSPAITFIKADARGLFSSIFSDFGPAHIVLDRNGEEPRQAIVVSISNVGFSKNFAYTSANFHFLEQSRNCYNT